MSIILSALIVLSLGGCNGSDSESSEKNLSEPPSLKELFRTVMDERRKDQFESTVDYENRLDSFAQSLVGYHATAVVRASYDADTRELFINTLPIRISEGVNRSTQVLYTGYTRLILNNIDSLYQPDLREEISRFSGEPFNARYYRIIPASPDEARELINGFRVDYSFRFTTDHILDADYRCISANFTQCINFLYADVATFRVYNVIDGGEY